MTRLEIIKEAIREFSFSNFGLDQLDELKEDPDTCEWIDALAVKIDEDLKPNLRWIGE